MTDGPTCHHLSLIVRSEETDDSPYRDLLQHAERAIATKLRARPFNKKSEILREHEFNLLVPQCRRTISGLSQQRGMGALKMSGDELR